MGNTNTKWVKMSDLAIVEQIGQFVRQVRLEQNKTQAQLAEVAGLNRWTISQLENGESVTMTSLIQILRALDSLYVLNAFEVSNEISPLEYVKLKKQQRQRVRNKVADPSTDPDASKNEDKDDLGW